MATILVFGDIPDNFLRSFSGAMDLHSPKIVRMGQEFLDARNAMQIKCDAAFEAAKAEFAQHRKDPNAYTDEELGVLYANKERVRQFALEFFGCISGDVHWVCHEELTGAAEEAHKLCTFPSVLPKHYAWTFKRGKQIMDTIVARMEGHSYFVRDSFKFDFNWDVYGTREVVHTYHQGPRSAVRTVTKIKTTEEWTYPIPRTAEQDSELSRLIEERNHAYQENSYGSEIDTSYIEEAVAEFCWNLG